MFSRTSHTIYALLLCSLGFSVVKGSTTPTLNAAIHDAFPIELPRQHIIPYTAPPDSHKKAITFLTHATELPKEWGEICDMYKDPITGNLKILARRGPYTAITNKKKYFGSFGLYSIAAVGAGCLLRWKLNNCSQINPYTQESIYLGGTLAISQTLERLLRSSHQANTLQYHEILICDATTLSIESQFKFEYERLDNVYFLNNANTVEITFDTIRKVTFQKDMATHSFTEIQHPMDRESLVSRLSQKIKKIINDTPSFIYDLRIIEAQNNIDPDLVNRDQELIKAEITKNYLEHTAIHNHPELYTLTQAYELKRVIGLAKGPDHQITLHLVNSGNTAKTKSIPFPNLYKNSKIRIVGKTKESDVMICEIEQPFFNRKTILLQISDDQFSPEIQNDIGDMIDSGTSEKFIQSYSWKNIWSKWPQRSQKIMQNIRSFYSVDRPIFKYASWGCFALALLAYRRLLYNNHLHSILLHNMEMRRVVEAATTRSPLLTMPENRELVLRALLR